MQLNRVSTFSGKGHLAIVVRCLNEMYHPVAASTETIRSAQCSRIYTKQLRYRYVNCIEYFLRL